MALLEILQYPDPRLRVKAAEVKEITNEIRQLVDDMYETMYHAKGVGLAATQVGINWRIFTMDVSEARDQRMCIINPEIVSSEGERFEDEGCLSVTGAYEKVKRAEKVRMRAMDLDGKTIEIDADGLMAHCIQHEIDHLNGKLFIDHLSKLKLDRLKKKLDKAKAREE